jgi:hypothetical protein
MINFSINLLEYNIEGSGNEGKGKSGHIDHEHH